MNRKAPLPAACVLALLCAWIVVPPFTLPLLIAAIVTIEYSPFLAAACIILLAFALRAPRSSQRTAAVTILAASLAVSAAPGLALISTYRAPQGGAAPLRRSAIHTLRIPIALGAEHTEMRAFLPSSAGRHPMVLALYGGAWQRGGPYKNADINRDLAERGYAVFALDYRHAPQYTFPAAQDDVQTQLDFLVRHAKEYGADPQRIALIGHSSGGTLAMLNAFQPGSRVRAIVSYSGGIDMPNGYKYPPHPDPIGVPGVIYDYLGATPQNAPARYAAASPISRVRAGIAPILMLYGTRDHVVDIQSPRALRDELLAHHDPVTYIEFPWAEHAFEEVPFGLHGGVALRAVEVFLAKTL